MKVESNMISFLNKNGSYEKIPQNINRKYTASIWKAFQYDKHLTRYKEALFLILPFDSLLIITEIGFVIIGLCLQRMNVKDSDVALHKIADNTFADIYIPEWTRLFDRYSF
jgi:hypothetical protein